jgi:hypothetical protein
MVNAGNWLIQLCFNNNLLHRSGSLGAGEQHGRSSKRKLLRKLVIVLLERKILRVDAIFMEVDFAGGLGNGPTRPNPSLQLLAVRQPQHQLWNIHPNRTHLDVAADFVQPTHRD